MANKITSDDPAVLAAEAMQIFQRIMQVAKITRSNGIEMPMIPMKFQLGDRLTRLCAALGVEDKPDEA